MGNMPVTSSNHALDHRLWDLSNLWPPVTEESVLRYQSTMSLKGHESTYLTVAYFESPKIWKVFTFKIKT